LLRIVAADLGLDLDDQRAWSAWVEAGLGLGLGLAVPGRPIGPRSREQAPMSFPSTDGSILNDRGGAKAFAE
jgi:hypothetical protein